MPVVILGVLGVLALFAVFVVIAITLYKQNKARIAALYHLAQSRGWQFTPNDPFGLPRRWPGTPFNSGYDRRAQNVITGEHHGHPLVAFDYSYKEDSTDSEGKSSTTTHTFGIVALGMPCALPEVHVGPEGVFSRIGKVVGFQDIELESEDFNRAFRVRCHDPKLATDVLSPRTMELLLAYGKIRFRLIGSDIVFYDSGCLEPYELARAADVLAGVLHGVPSFVWRDYGLGERSATPTPGNRP